MSKIIQVRRNTKANIPTLQQGEPFWATDENLLYVGDGSTNHLVVSLSALNIYQYKIGNYASLAAALTAIGSSNATLVIDQAITLTASATIPSTCTVVFLSPGKITKASTYTLTINGPIVAAPYQIFSGFTTVTFGNATCKEVYAEWFGAVADGTTDNVDSLQAAIDSIVASTYHPKLKLLPGKYAFGTGLSWSDDYITIEGCTGGVYDPTGLVPSNNATYLYYTGTGAGITITGRGFKGKSFMLIGNAAATKGMKIGAADWHLEDITIAGCTKTNSPGLELGSTTAGTAYNCAFHYNYNGIQLNSYADIVTTVRFRDCSFSFNANYGSYDRGAVMPVYDGCVFQSNTNAGIRIDQATTLEGYALSCRNCYFENITNAYDIYISGAATEGYQDPYIEHPVFATNNGTGYNIYVINVTRMMVVAPRFSGSNRISEGSGCTHNIQLQGITSSLDIQFTPDP